MYRPAAILTALILLAVPGAVLAHDFTHGDIQVMHPWAMVAEQGKSSAAFVTIFNGGSEPDKLVGVETKAAERVEIQKAKKGGKPIKYETILDLIVEPKKRVEMKPGGIRLLLVGLGEPLRHEYTTPMTLVFEKAGRVPIQAVIQKSSAEGHTR
jgi:periplasmic copper chaperone A